jgi:transposase
MEKAKLTPNQLRAISYILESSSIEEAARKAKVSRGTLYNWMKEELFHEKLTEERTAIFNESLGLIKQATREAVNVLVDLLKCKNETTRRLAAREILGFSIRITEIKDIEERVSKVEQIVEQKFRYL